MGEIPELTGLAYQLGFDYPTLMTVEMGIIQAAPPKREEPKPAGSQVMGSH